jgi:hypothetical protein
MNDVPDSESEPRAEGASGSLRFESPFDGGLDAPRQERLEHLSLDPFECRAPETPDHGSHED